MRLRTHALAHGHHDDGALLGQVGQSLWLLNGQRGHGYVRHCAHRPVSNREPHEQRDEYRAALEALRQQRETDH